MGIPVTGSLENDLPANMLGVYFGPIIRR